MSSLARTAQWDEEVIRTLIESGLSPHRERPNGNQALLYLRLLLQAIAHLAGDLGVTARLHEVGLCGIHQALAGAIHHAAVARRRIENVLCRGLLAIGCGDRDRADENKNLHEFRLLLVTYDMSRARTMPCTISLDFASPAETIRRRPIARP